MPNFEFQFTLSRSNPLIIRTGQISSSCTVKDLTAFVMISFGLEYDEKNSRIHWDFPYTKDFSDPLEEIFKERTFAAMTLTGNQKAGQKGALTFLLEKLSCSEGAPVTVPMMTSAYGLNLPQNITMMNLINSYQFQMMNSRLPIELPGKSFYYPKEAFFDIAKTENRIRLFFAPETAERGICMDFSAPMKKILNSFRVSDLKDVMNFYGMPTWMNKKDLIEINAPTMCNPEFLDRIFEELPLADYQFLKSILLSENAESDFLNLDMEDDLNWLFHSCLTGIISGRNYIAREFLEYYQEWYRTEKEKSLLYRKYIYFSAYASVLFYGVASASQIRRVMNLLYPESGIDSRIFSREWKTMLNHTKTLKQYHISILDQNLLYLDTRYTLREAQNLWKKIPSVLKKDPYLPSVEAFRSMFEHNLIYSHELLEQTEEQITPYVSLRYYYNTPGRIADELITDLILGKSVDSVFENYSFYFLDKNHSHARDTLKKVLLQLNSTVRKHSYAGYTEAEAKERGI